MNPSNISLLSANNPCTDMRPTPLPAGLTGAPLQGAIPSLQPQRDTPLLNEAWRQPLPLIWD